MTASINQLSHLLDIYDFLPLSNRNYIVDGAFEQWSSTSGTTGPATGYVSSVMWAANAGAGGAGTFGSGDIRTFNPAQFDAPFRSCGVYVQTTASTANYATGNSAYVQQKLEGVGLLSGRSATFSIRLWCAAGTVTIPYVLNRQSFGTGGSPSAVVINDVAVNWTVTTTPQKFSVRLDIPSIAGKTIGTNNDDFMSIGLMLPPGVTFQLDMAQAQLEQSSPQAPAAGLPTAFEYRGYQAELARVQRYYLAPVFGSIQCGYADVSTRSISPLLYWFPVAMRVAPTCTVSTSGGVNASVGAPSVNQYGMVIGCNGVAAGYVQYSYILTSFDARL